MKIPAAFRLIYKIEPKNSRDWFILSPRCYLEKSQEKTLGNSRLQ